MKYKVSIKGFTYVMASSEEEAKEKALDGESVYEEIGADTVEPVDEFIVNVRGETP